MDRRLSLLVTFAGLDRLTAPLRRIGQGSRSTQRDLAGTTRELANLQRAQDKIARVRSMRAGMDQQNAKLDEVRRKIRGLREEMAATDTPTKRMTAALAAAERQERRMAAAAASQSDRLQQLQREMREAGIDTSRLGDHERDLAAQIERANQALAEQRRRMEAVAARERRNARLNEVGGNLQAAGGASMAAGAAIVAPLAVGVKSAIDFESSMADVKKAVDGLQEPAALAAMRSDILKLGHELPIAATGIAQIVAAGGQAGFARDELVGFTRDAARMSVAFDQTADEAGDTMAKWRTAFSLSQKEVVDLADKVNFLSDKTAASAQQISGIVTRIGPLGGVAGLASGQIAALGATLASMGVEEEIAATGIKNTMLALTKGEAATKDQKKAFGDLGLEAVKTSKAMQMDASGTIIDVLGRVSKLSKDKQASVLSELFGSESVGAIAPLLTQLDTLQANLKSVGQGGGYSNSMLNEFTNRSGTTANKLQLMSNRVEEMKIRLGDRLLPMVVKAADKIGALADRVSAFAERNPRLTDTLLKIAVTIGALLVVFGSVGVVAGTLVRAWTVISTVGGVLIRNFGLVRIFLSAMFNPIRMIAQGFMFLITTIAGIVGLPVLAVAAIGIAIAAAGYLIYRYWDQIKAAFNTGLEFFKSLGASMYSIGVNIVQGLINGVGSMFGAMKDKIVGLGKSAVGWFKGVLGIHSPSRVFQELGGQVTSGLTIGIDRGSAAPVDRVRGLASRVATTAATVTSAVAMGASPAAAAPVAPVASAATSAGTVHHHYNDYQINLPASASADARAMARAVMIEIRRLQAQDAASAYGDD